MSQRRFRRTPGGVCSLGLHLVWCPKYRRRVLGGRVAARCGELLEQIAAERKSAGFTRTDAEGSHGKWTHPSGAKVSIPDGHRTISPGVVRQVNNAITAATKPADDDRKGEDD